MTMVIYRVKRHVETREARMRGTRAQAAENRDRIVAAAAQAFRERGFDGIGIAQIMQGVGLTHGGFYGHFGSKEELMALACRRAVADMLADWRARAAAAPGDPAATIVAPYLAAGHRDAPGATTRSACSPASSARWSWPAPPAIRRSPTRCWRSCAPESAVRREFNLSLRRRFCSYGKPTGNRRETDTDCSRLTTQFQRLAARGSADVQPP